MIRSSADVQQETLLFSTFSNFLLLYYCEWGGKYSCLDKMLSPTGWENCSKCYLLSVAPFFCKFAKLTSLSIKIKTTLAKEEIGQILSFVCKHAEEKYTNGSSMILHDGPLQVLKNIQGALSSKVENLPRISSHTPFLSGKF